LAKLGVASGLSDVGGVQVDDSSMERHALEIRAAKLDVANLIRDATKRRVRSRQRLEVRTCDEASRVPRDGDLVDDEPGFGSAFVGRWKAFDEIDRFVRRAMGLIERAGRELGASGEDRRLDETS